VDTNSPFRGQSINGHRLSVSRYYAGVSTTEQPKQQRKDAVRNRQRILDAAKELFAERGLGVTLHDIAARAGVGVGTIYRHFPEKKPLIDAIFEQHVAEMTEVFEQALADPDPWRSIVTVHEQVLEHQARNRALKELLLGTADAPERAKQIRAQLHPLAAQVIERGKAAGVVRADCETQDFGLLQTMVGAVMDASAEVEPDLWRRYFTIALQGLRPAGAPLEPLPVPPLPPEQMEDLLVGQWKPRKG
jgi:AcrR family transcriptional regulator